MKTFFAILLAAITFTAGARADRILIYKGSQTSRTNGGKGRTDSSYVLFDLDTLEYDYVLYGGVGAGKFHSLLGPVAIIDSPIGIPSGKTQTYFAYSTTTTTTPFTLLLGAFWGTNSSVAIGGGTTMEAPKKLTQSYRGIGGDGTEPDDTVTTITGMYDIDLTFTVESNTVPDNLTEATDIVLNALTLKGY